MMHVPNPNVRFTYEDYRSLPESMDKRYELLDGDLVRVPAPTVTHQRVLRNLGYLLVQFVRAHGLGVMFYAPIDVVLGQGRDREVVQPDLVFSSQARLSLIVEEEIRGAPDLVVEILSPGTEGRDRGYKKALYARYGVHGYWIVDPKETYIEVYVPSQAGFRLAGRFDAKIPLISALFPALELDLTEVFQAD